MSQSSDKFGFFIQNPFSVSLNLNLEWDSFPISEISIHICICFLKGPKQQPFLFQQNLF